jgi:hypothetical protein
MNKTIKFILALAIIIIAVALILHHTNFAGMMRRLHGG